MGNDLRIRKKKQTSSKKKVIRAAWNSGESKDSVAREGTRNIKGGNAKGGPLPMR